jgi:hypothetical protein
MNVIINVPMKLKNLKQIKRVAAANKPFKKNCSFFGKVTDKGYT